MHNETAAVRNSADTTTILSSFDKRLLAVNTPPQCVFTANDSVPSGIMETYLIVQEDTM